jgi:lambda repressor-like predicted transcriptional regulator
VENGVDFKKRLQVECWNRGISRAALARSIGKTPQTLHDMLTRGNMKATVLRDIATVLQVPMEILMTPVSDLEYAEAKARKTPKPKRREQGKGEFFG